MRETTGEGIALTTRDEERDPITLRFRDPELERAYQADAGIRSRPQVQATLLLGAASWAATAVLLALLFPLDTTPLFVSIGTVIALILGLYVSLRRARTWDALQAISALVNLIGGVAIIVIGSQIVGMPQLVAPALLVGLLFAFGLNRFGPLGVAITLPYLALYGLLAVAGLVPTAGGFEVFLVAIGFGVAAIGGYVLEASARGLFQQRRIIAAQKAALAAEQEKSERLLDNMLPRHIADRLRESPTSVAERIPDVSVLFADLVGFTRLAARISPDLLVETLDELFSRFDELAARHGLEKIKTIGDAYMAVAGPSETSDPADQARRAVAMGRDMLDVVKAYGESVAMPLTLRVGIDSGPVVAGVIGRVRFSYDLWGDTVNVASRMESQGVAGAIHITSATARRLGSNYGLQTSGVIDVRGKGPMVTYLIRPQSSDAVPQPRLPGHPGWRSRTAPRRTRRSTSPRRRRSSRARQQEPLASG